MTDYKLFLFILIHLLFIFYSSGFAQFEKNPSNFLAWGSAGLGIKSLRGTSGNASFGIQYKPGGIIWWINL